jgi:hypothetical protein
MDAEVSKKNHCVQNTLSYPKKNANSDGFIQDFAVMATVGMWSRLSPQSGRGNEFRADPSRRWAEKRQLKVFEGIGCFSIRIQQKHQDGVGHHWSSAFAGG